MYDLTHDGTYWHCTCGEKFIFRANARAHKFLAHLSVPDPIDSDRPINGKADEKGACVLANQVKAA